MEQRSGWEWLWAGGGLAEVFGQKIVDRALEPAKADGCLPEMNFIPYLHRALDEKERASDSASVEGENKE